MNQTAENAIHAWVYQASGLPAERVLWEGRHPYPSAAWIQMRVTGERPFGGEWLDREPTGNDEVRYKARGLAIVTLELQAIAGPEGGESSCIALLRNVIKKRKLPSVAQALAAAGVGVLSYGDVLWAPATRGEAFEARAVAEIELTVASEVSEVGPAIKHVEIEGNYGHGTDTLWAPDAPPAET